MDFWTFCQVLRKNSWKISITLKQLLTYSVNIVSLKCLPPINTSETLQRGSIDFEVAPSTTWKGSYVLSPEARCFFLSRILKSNISINIKIIYEQPLKPVSKFQQFHANILLFITSTQTSTFVCPIWWIDVSMMERSRRFFFLEKHLFGKSWLPESLLIFCISYFDRFHPQRSLFYGQKKPAHVF